MLMQHSSTNAALAAAIAEKALAYGEQVGTLSGSLRGWLLIGWLVVNWLVVS